MKKNLDSMEETLRQQFEMLAKESQTCEPELLPQLSIAMCEIAKTLEAPRTL